MRQLHRIWKRNPDEWNSWTWATEYNQGSSGYSTSMYCKHNYEIVNDSNTIEPFHNNKRKTSAICLEDWKNVFNFTEYR